MHIVKSFLFAVGLSISAALIPAIAGSSAMADTLVIENTGQFYSDAKPQKGMTKAQVRKRFGEPMDSFAPVGNPPITRWKYNDFTVYFEHSHVIHAVNNNRTRSLK